MEESGCVSVSVVLVGWPAAHIKGVSHVVQRY